MAPGGPSLPSWPCGFDSRHPLHRGVAGNRSPVSRDAAYVRAVCGAVRTLILPTNESLHQARRRTRRVVTVESMAMAIGPADWNGGRAEMAVVSAARGRPQTGGQRHTHQTGVRAHQCQGGVTPASVDRDGNACLIEAAAALNSHVVLMSVLGRHRRTRWSCSG